MGLLSPNRVCSSFFQIIIGPFQEAMTDLI